MLRRMFFWLAAVITVSALFTAEGRGCSCRFGGGPPCEEYWRVEAIFAGTALAQKLIEVDEGSYKFQRRLMRFKLDEAFKGMTAGAEVEILTGLGGGDCGYPFKIGERYLVYASRDRKDDSRWYSGICTRTRLLAEAEEDLAYFRNLPAAGAGATIKGRIVRQSIPLKDDSRFATTPLESIKVTVEGQDRRYETLTDKEGYYQVSGLTAGHYKVRADLPTAVGRLAQTEVNVVDRGCAAADLKAQVDGQISGRVMDQEGRPLNVRVDVIAVEDVAETAPQGRMRFSQDDGRYQLQWLPPGRYYVGINLIGAPSARCPYSRTYLPGVEKIADAQIVTLSEGQKLEDQNIILPAGTPDLEVEVEIVWPNGTPADAAVAMLHGESSSLQFVSERPVKIGPGVYRIKGYKACTRWLKAFTYGHPGEPGGGEPWHDEVMIDPTKKLEQRLRLVLSKPGFLCRHQQPK